MENPTHKTPEVTAEDIQQILYKHLNSKDFTVVNYEVVPFEIKCGFLSDQKWIHVKFLHQNQPKSAKFFMKSLTVSPDHRKFVESYNGFNREIHIYDDIIERCFKPYDSKCNFAGKVLFTRENEFLVIENLQEQDFKSIPRGRVLNYSEIKCIAEKLAQFHALSFVYNYYHKTTNQTIVNQTNVHFYEEPYYFTDDHSHQIFAPLDGLKFQIDYFTELTESNTERAELKNKLEKIFLNFPEYVKPCEKSHLNVVSHGDLHAGNILVRTNSQNEIIDCKLIDFQTIRYAPVGHDFLFMVYFLTDSDFQKNLLTSVIDDYYELLKNELKKYRIKIEDVMTYEDYLDSCKYLQPFAITQAINYHQILSLSPVYIDNVYRNAKLARIILGENNRVIPLQDHLPRENEKPKFDDELYRKKCYEGTKSMIQFLRQWSD